MPLWKCHNEKQAINEVSCKDIIKIQIAPYICMYCHTHILTFVPWSSACCPSLSWWDESVPGPA
jgi:hypothetical protein